MNKDKEEKIKRAVNKIIGTKMLDGVTLNSKIRIMSTGKIGTFIFFVGSENRDFVCVSFDGQRRIEPTNKCELIDE